MTPEARHAITIRFAGDAGDGITLLGSQFARTSAAAGNDVHTLPDYPAEIRAPAGSLAGVTAFQVQFAAAAVHTHGDRVQALVALNPAALRANAGDVEPGGLIVVDSDRFIPGEWEKAGYSDDPRRDGTLDGFDVLSVPVHALNREAVVKLNLSPRETDRCRSFFILGLVYWLFDRPVEPTLDWLRQRFAANPDIYQANRRSLKAGFRHGQSLGRRRWGVPVGELELGVFRRLTGIDAVALGLAAAAERSRREVVFAAFPTPPAVELLHKLIELQPAGVRTVSAEDEGAAAALALGASFGGAIGVTAGSGPGLGQILELVGLAVAAELPLVLFVWQRGGPSLGMPTKTEQADLLAALFGRNGESPVAVLAIRSPSDGFSCTLEAVRLATRYMLPVIVLGDVDTAHAAEPWPIPAVADLPDLTIDPPRRAGEFRPYDRDVRLARPWATPGQPGLEHRVGGLEIEDGSGAVSYEPADHEHMVHVRAQKVAQLAGDMPPIAIDGPPSGELVVVGWGGTYGPIRTAVERVRSSGRAVAHVHLRYLNPMPAKLGDVLRRFERVLVPELNTGQLRMLLRASYLIDAVGLNKVQGRPFLVGEIEDAIRSHLPGARAGVQVNKPY